MRSSAMGWFAGGLALLALSCGGGSGGGAGGEGGDGGNGGDGGSSLIRITSPSKDVFTNGSFTVQVVVEEEQVFSVQLLLNGSTHVVLPRPFTYVFDTLDLEEGAYSLAAKAMVRGVPEVSAARTVHVDRTPPSIISRAPEKGATGGSLREPIRIGFSEPVQIPSLETVALLGDGEPLKRDGGLTEAGDELVFHLRGPLFPPSSIRVSVAGVSDLAGNSLPPAEWSWKVPGWTPIGGGLRVDPQAIAVRPSLALGGDGAPIVAWTEHKADVRRVHVKRWNGSGWEHLGGKELNVNPARLAAYPAIAVAPDGSPVVTWGEWSEDDDDEEVYVSTWDGKGWRLLGNNLIEKVDSFVFGKAIVVDSGGRVIVAWSEEVREEDDWGWIMDLPRIRVVRWDGRSWEVLGTFEREIFDPLAPSLVLDPKGNLHLAARYDLDESKVWLGPDWEALNAFGPDPLSVPALAHAGDRFYFAMAGGSRPHELLFFENTTKRAELRGRFQYPRIEIAPDGNPIVFCQTDVGGEKYGFAAMRWDGSLLETIAEDEEQLIDGGSLGARLDPEGRPIVAFSKDGDVYVKTLNFLP